ncbi:PEP-CTERM sorting domain-containing protein [Anabaena sp. CCY 9402-a]|uniref:PEP-CTERM sorting domain-containing protein n=1 Tax=Anabaena sp. CCY 9402-a TaxID=3103867 RepID=UPI0039C5AA20
MDKFKSLFLGATMAAATVTAVSFAPSAAMAVQLFGDIIVEGAADLGPNNQTPANTGITWTSNTGTVGNTSNGSFLPLIGTSVNLKNIALTIDDITQVSNPAPVGSSAVYNFAAITDFINFGVVNNLPVLFGPPNLASGNLTFDLDAGSLVRQVFGGGQIQYSLDGATGTFKLVGVGGDITTAQGFLTGNQSGTAGNFSISMTAQPVPEPLTMGGLAIGAGFGAFLKKRYSKKEKQLVKA